jgi:hypothetical protein
MADTDIDAVRKQKKAEYVKQYRLKRKLLMQQNASRSSETKLLEQQYVWHVYVSPKTYTWSGTSVIKDGRYMFEFFSIYMCTLHVLSIKRSSSGVPQPYIQPTVSCNSLELKLGYKNKFWVLKLLLKTWKIHVFHTLSVVIYYIRFLGLFRLCVYKLSKVNLFFNFHQASIR